MKKNIKLFLLCMAVILALTALTACNPGEPPATEPTEHTHQGGEATCLEPAVCTLCGEFYGEAKGHSFGQWEVTKEATRKEAGEEIRSCACGETETRQIASLGGANPVVMGIIAVVLMGAFAGVTAAVVVLLMLKKRT